MDSLNDALESLTNSSSFGEPMYVTYPNVDLDYVLINNDDVHSYIRESFEKQIYYFQENCGERADQIIHQVSVFIKISMQSSSAKFRVK